MHDLGQIGGVYTMSKFATFMDDVVLPTVTKLSENKVVRSIQAGAMSTMPLTLGVSLLAIVVNLPIQAWSTWLSETGIAGHMNATIKVTMEISALYMTFMIGFFNAQERKRNGLTGGIMALGAFLILMPHTIPYEGGVASGLNFDYLGSSGIFTGMIVAILISGAYVFLDKKGWVIKLPQSIPPMVAQSLSPTFIAIMIFTTTFLVRVGLAATSYEHLFNLINTVLGAPLVSLGTSIPSAFIFYTVMNLMWFFGIHPMTALSVYLPVLMTAGVTNLNAYMANQAMPFLAFTAVGMYSQVGGTGNTFGLALMMPFIAKSERYKALSKIALAPGIFNINEPFIFGLPIMLNPLFLVPLVATPIVNGLIGLAAFNLGVYNTLNPTISLPWIMPIFVSQFFTIGIKGALTAIVVIVVDALIYLPFFRKADRIALEEERIASLES